MDEPQCVRITVTGSDEHGEIRLNTRGQLWDTPGGWCLRYEETNPDDLSSSETLMLCQGEHVTVTRSGTMLSTIIFAQQETFIGDYPTPVGNFQLRVYPSEVEIKRRGLVGRIRLVYQVTLSTAFSPSEDTSTRSLDVRFVPCRN